MVNVSAPSGSMVGARPSSSPVGSTEQYSTLAAVNPKTPRRVPKFYPDSGRPEMNRLQKSFYRRTFLPSLLAGEPVDVKGQTGYGSVLLYELLDERRTNPLEAGRTLGNLLSAYRSRDLPSYAESALADFYFLEGDFAAGYAALGIWASPSHHLTLGAHLNHPPLTAMQVLRWGEWRITRKGIGHLDEIVPALQARLDDFHVHHGLSVLEDFWRRITADKPVNEVAASIEDDVQLRYTREEVRYFLTEARKENPAQEPPKAFEDWPGYEEPLDWPCSWVPWTLHYALVSEFWRTLIRQAENTAREGAGIPRVGEGWVSEMTLLRQVQHSFPGERVLHQARPGWLAPQSLDIYLPDYNVGIEYQGAQHIKPVEYFGGAKAFEVQQERDARKLHICGQYGCTLVEVYPGYQLEQVVALVRSAIQDAGRGPTSAFK